MRGGNTFGRKPERPYKSHGKPEKPKKFCGKPEKTCARNRKMPFLCHGNPEKWENMVETGKHNLKFAETGKVFLEAAESLKKPKKTFKVE